MNEETKHRWDLSLSLLKVHPDRRKYFDELGHLLYLDAQSQTFYEVLQIVNQPNAKALLMAYSQEIHEKIEYIKKGVKNEYK